MRIDAEIASHSLIRITCVVHHFLARKVSDRLLELGIHSGWVESARSVRFRVRTRFMGIPWRSAETHDSPMDVFRVAVPPAAAGRVMSALTDAAELRTPGHGMLYAQDIVEYSRFKPVAVEPDSESVSGRLRDIVLLTCILSTAGSGEHLARIVLDLGAGVPVISGAIGTGIRNRMGLLRITISPEKEVVRLMIPSHDAVGIRRILIEGGRLNRPGGGFLYQTPIREGVIDPLLRIGRQEHAASMEQMIAALDEIKGTTAWRKRYAGIGDRPEDLARRMRRHYRELTFACTEGHAEQMVQTAMSSGAEGATISRARAMHAGNENPDERTAAREIGVLCVPVRRSDAVWNALCDAAAKCDDSGFRVQVMEAPAVFSYR